MKITELILSLSIAGMVAIVNELQILGANLEKKISKPNIVYIADALLNAIFGFMFALTTSLVVEDLPIIWLLGSMIGALLGIKTFKIILWIFLNILKIFQEVDLGKIIDDMVDNKDDNNEDNKDKENKNNKS